MTGAERHDSPRASTSASPTRQRVRAGTRAAPLVGALLAVGLACGADEGAPDELCDLACDCTECTDDEERACRQGADTTYDSSVKKGCTDHADAFIACYEAEFSCRAKVVDVAACDEKKKVWYDCLAGTTTTASACDDADVKRVDECGLEAEGTAAEECEGIPLCTSECVLAASCAELSGEVEDGGFGPCMDACLTQQ